MPVVEMGDNTGPAKELWEGLGGEDKGKGKVKVKSKDEEEVSAILS